MVLAEQKMSQRFARPVLQLQARGRFALRNAVARFAQLQSRTFGLGNRQALHRGQPGHVTHETGDFVEVRGVIRPLGHHPTSGSPPQRDRSLGPRETDSRNLADGQFGEQLCAGWNGLLLP